MEGRERVHVLLAGGQGPGELGLDPREFGERLMLVMDALGPRRALAQRVRFLPAAPVVVERQGQPVLAIPKAFEAACDVQAALRLGRITAGHGEVRAVIGVGHGEQHRPHRFGVHQVQGVIVVEGARVDGRLIAFAPALAPRAVANGADPHAIAFGELALSLAVIEKVVADLGPDDVGEAVVLRHAESASTSKRQDRS